MKRKASSSEEKRARVKVQATAGLEEKIKQSLTKTLREKQ